MRYTAWISILFAAGAASALAACGDDTSGAGGSGGAGTSSSTGKGTTGATTGATTGTTSSTTGSSTSSSSSSGGPTLVNGCDPTKLEEHTNQAAVEIKFGGAGADFLTYRPACISVSKNTKVNFTGDFTLHPLSGGTVKDMVATPDTASPIKSTITGMTASFTLDAAGQFPYYCVAHANLGMTGLIVVK